MKKLILIVAMAALVAGTAWADTKEVQDIPGNIVRVGDPGPDAFGYMRVDVPGVWTFQEISGTGTFIVSGDDAYADYNLSTPFSFYGTSYNLCTPSTNGGITWDQSYMNLSNVCPLPDQLGIFLFNDDLTCYNGIYGEYFEVCPMDGDAGVEPCTIIMWDEVDHYGSLETAFDMELVLFHSSNNIGFLYDDRFEQDAGGTVGIDSGNGTDAMCLTINCNDGTAPAPGTQYLIRHPNAIANEEMTFGALKTMYR